MNADDAIRFLHLAPLACEGGHFFRSYESAARLPGTGQKLGSAIYYLLRGKERSAWHRVRNSDEIWFAHGPATALQMIVSPDGAEWEIRKLGPLPTDGLRPQAPVPRDYWQTTRIVAPSSDAWALFSTVVIPEFRYEDFESTESAALAARNPELAAAIREFERDAF